MYLNRVYSNLPLSLLRNSRGGNFLLNVGPTHDGRIPPIMEERLLQLGAYGCCISSNRYVVEYSSNRYVVEYSSNRHVVEYSSNRYVVEVIR